MLKNNLVSAPLYYCFLLVQYGELLLLYMVFAFVYYSDSGGYLDSMQPTYQAIESALRGNRTFQVTVIGTILLYDLLTILLLVLNAASFESPEAAKRQNGRSQLLSFAL